MKILFISNIGLPKNFPNVDYMNDMVFHGFRSLFGADCVDYCEHPSAYNGISDEDRRTMYGRGFTIAGTLDRLAVDRTDIENKIKHKFYDLIVYGQCTRCLEHIALVTNCYPKEKIIFIDGEDDTRIQDVTTIGHYFKREFIGSKNEHPITFCVPEDKIVLTMPEKVKDLSSIVPGQTYNFNTEEEYYAEYQSSRFAVTCKKAGWDCLRHYEIMMNRCIPYVREIETIPEHTMTHFPKALVERAMLLINTMNGNTDEYLEAELQIHEHMKKHLTTTAMAKYILETVKCQIQ